MYKESFQLGSFLEIKGGYPCYLDLLHQLFMHEHGLFSILFILYLSYIMLGKQKIKDFATLEHPVLSNRERLSLKQADNFQSLAKDMLPLWLSPSPLLLERLCHLKPCRSHLKTALLVSEWL